jgi:hypothetical protein
MASVEELIYKRKFNSAITPGASSSEAAGVEVYSTTANAILVSDGSNWRYAGDTDRMQAIATAGTAQTLDRQQYAAFRLVGSASSCAITLSGTVSGKEAIWTMYLIQDGTGSRAFTFTNTILWLGGTAYTASTAANAKDRVVVSWDGTSYFGTFGKAFA